MKYTALSLTLCAVMGVSLALNIHTILAEAVPLAVNPISEGVPLKVHTISRSTQGRTLGEQDSCTEAGFFADTNDCKKFHRCVDVGPEAAAAAGESEAKTGNQFTKYTFECPAGTAFDEEVITCNYPNQIANPSENCKIDAESPPQPEGENSLDEDSFKQFMTFTHDGNKETGTGSTSVRVIQPWIIATPYHNILLPYGGHWPAINVIHYGKK